MLLDFYVANFGKKILLGICSRGILLRIFSCDRIFHREYFHVCNALNFFVTMSKYAALHSNDMFHNFYRIELKYHTVQWRNGWFAHISDAAKASNQPDPSPYHTAIMGPLYVKVTHKTATAPATLRSTIELVFPWCLAWTLMVILLIILNCIFFSA